MKKADTLHIHGEPSLIIGDETARLTCTQRGGHVRIDVRGTDGQWHSPYSLPPWQPANEPAMPPLLQILRGDFFCFPFGVTEGSAYPHGETANRTWRVESTEGHAARLVLELEEMPGRVTKILRFDPASAVLLQEHVIEGVDGTFNYGHHPILAVPEGKRGLLSASPIRFGQVHAGFAVAEAGEKSSLKCGARFDSLDKVDCANGSTSTLAEFPMRPASEDLVMFAAAGSGIAWNAMSMPGYLWISLRRVNDFPASLLWMSNGGRPQPPWSGKHTGRIGIEDVCSYFDKGAHISRRGLLDDEGIPTSRVFRADTPVRLPHLQAVIPRTKNVRVTAIELVEAQSAVHITFADGTDHTLQIPEAFPGALAPDVS